MIANLKAQVETLRQEIAANREAVTRAGLEKEETSERYEKMNAALCKAQNEAADAKSDLEDLRSRSRIERQKRQQSVVTGDKEYINLKYEDWRRKMMCMTCKSNENDIILSCGHMSCNNCIEESFASRQRVCPVDRKKISKNDVIKIYWNELE